MGCPALVSSLCRGAMQYRVRKAKYLNFASAITLVKPFRSAPAPPNHFCCNSGLQDSKKREVFTTQLSREELNMSLDVNRRGFAQLALSSLSVFVLKGALAPSPSAAIASPFATPIDLIARVGQRVPRRPQEKLFEDDIYYPDYFAGVWRTESMLISVTCPAGYKLFGRPGTFEAVQRDLNHTLEYNSRFIRVGKRVISDRPFNVKAVSEASMGTSSVLDCFQPGDNPNRLTAIVRPNEAGGGVFIVTLKALARQQQEGPLPRAVGEGVEAEVRTTFDTEPSEAKRASDEIGFGLYTSEMVRQEVRLDTEDLRVTPMIREVETTTLFVTKPKNENVIEAWQKTSSYLTRSSLLYADARGRPVDVRWYQLKYYRPNNMQ